MTVERMDNVGIVVEDIDAAIGFFTELGLELERRAPIEGEWAEGVTGLRGMRGTTKMPLIPDEICAHPLYSRMGLAVGRTLGHFTRERKRDRSNL